MQDDQNKTSSSNTMGVATPPPSAPEITDVPPPPVTPIVPTEQKSDAAEPFVEAAPGGVTPSGAANDSTIPPVITTSGGKPKGRFGGRMGKKGKIVATILGLLFLVGSVGAGVLLVQRNQDISEKAGVTTNITDKVTISQNQIDICLGAIGKCTDLSTCGVMVSHFKCDSNNLPGGCQQNGIIKTFAAPAGSTWGFSTGQTCGTQQIDYGCRDENGTYGSLGFLSYIGSTSCGGGAICSDDSDSACVNKDPRDSCGNNKECKKDGSNTGNDGKPICKCRNIPTTPPTESPTASPTATPTTPPITAQCLEVKAFDTEFNQLTLTDLALLSPRATVIFTVAGTATSGTFIGARFTINGVVRPVVTELRPGTEEFMDTYVIPEDTTSFSIKGEVQHSELGFF